MCCCRCRSIWRVVLVSQGRDPELRARTRTRELVSEVAYTQPKVDAAGSAVLDAKDGQPVTEAATTRTQTLAMGPVASQEAIKMIGTNGGGFFNANSAHPYENPTPLANFAARCWPSS